MATPLWKKVMGNPVTGNTSWIVRKVDEIAEWTVIAQTAQDEQTRNNAYLEAVKRVGQLAGVGIPIFFLEKSGALESVDRLALSLRNSHLTVEQLMVQQKSIANTRNMAFGLGGEWVLDEFGQYIGEQGWLDWAFYSIENFEIDAASRGLRAFYLDPLFEKVDEFFAAAQSYVRPRFDPLALDLDGDGVETLGIDAGVMFDQNADGIQTGTGWVGKDDGFLVLDKNGNGAIDDGQELFGDAFIKADGSKASHGFDALASLDSNADGQVDAHDAAWSNLRVWIDADSDGVTSQGELKTLDELDIVALNTAGTAVNRTLADGNVMADEGSFVRRSQDGQTQATHKMGDLDLIQDTFHTRFTNTIPISEEVKGLPDMHGSGRVRVLRQAASMETLQGGELKSRLSEYAAATTRAEQLARIDHLLLAWANTSDMKATLAERNPNVTVQWTSQSQQAQWEDKLHVIEAFNGRYYFAMPGEEGNGAREGISFSLPDSDGKQTAYVSLWVDQQTLLQQGYDAIRESVYKNLLFQTRFKPYVDSMNLVRTGAGDAYWDAAFLNTQMQTRLASADMSERNAALTDLVEMVRYGDRVFAESNFNGAFLLHDFVTRHDLTPELQALYADLGILVEGMEGHGSVGSGGHDVYVAKQTGGLLQAFGGNDVLFGAAGVDYLHGGEDNDVLSGGAGNDYLYGEGGDDVYLFGRGDGSDTIVDAHDGRVNRKNILRFKDGVTQSDVVVSRDNTDLVLAISGTLDQVRVKHFFQGDNPLNAYNPVQAVMFSDGSVWDVETLSQRAMRGTEGGDTLNGTVHEDVMMGHGGKDYLYAKGGDDILDGGQGNDFLYGQEGNDTYLFGKGDGQDTIGSDYDPLAMHKDNVLRFKAGIVPEEVVIKRSGLDLMLSIDGTNDSVKVGSFFYEDNPHNVYNPIQRIVFEDGTVWSIDSILEKLFSGTEGNDNVVGTVAGDVIRGQAGADVIYGRGGDDALIGGAGKDTLYGENGNDILEGGADQDQLHGGAGDDVYLFGKGDGQDTIGSDYEPNADKQNVLRFKVGVQPDEVMAKRVGDHLVLSIVGTTDMVTISSFFYQDNPNNAYNPIQRVEFSDGSSWDVDALVNKVFEGTAGADSIAGLAVSDVIHGQAGADMMYGRQGDDTLYGDDGNDYLYGENGDDTLVGGAGQDVLSGGGGNDVYIFAKGDGQDIISSDYDTSAGKLNVLRFDQGVLPSEVQASRSGNDLILAITGTSDKVTVGSFFHTDNVSNVFNPIQRVEFADGTQWDAYTLVQKIFSGSDGVDSITGLSGDDVIQGQAGGDTLYGRNGNDTLLGGDGNDYLYGENGHDVLEGGSGRDYLYGGAGNDTYWFGRGDGQDNIGADYDTSANKLNVLRFKEGVGAEEVVARRIGYDLVLSIVGTADQITVGSFFYQDKTDNAYSAIQQVTFADGTHWEAATIIEKVLAGTESADSITGLSGDDVIQGKGGSDSLYGRDGDDVLDGGQGNDSLSGDNGADALRGGEGNDSLYGGHGDDVLEGGAGSDYVSGGSGNDTYRFGRGDGSDVLYEYDTAAGNHDVLEIIGEVAHDQLWFQRLGNNLVVSVIGTSDQVMLNNWYSGSAYQVEALHTASGDRTLLASQVDNLVQAMAAFTPPAAGQTTLTQDYQQALSNAIAVNWQ